VRILNLFKFCAFLKIISTGLVNPDKSKIMTLLKVDFNAVFRVEASVPELMLRGVLLYLGVLFLMRVLPRRTGGEMAMMDLIFVLLIAEAATHALGDYQSVTEGFIAIGTLIACNYLANVLSYYVPFVEKLISAPPTQIIKNGELLRRNMRREYLTSEELYDHLRLEGIDDVKEIKAAYIESDGKISVLRHKGKE